MYWNVSYVYINVYAIHSTLCCYILQCLTLDGPPVHPVEPFPTEMIAIIAGVCGGVILLIVIIVVIVVCRKKSTKEKSKSQSSGTAVSWHHSISLLVSPCSHTQNTVCTLAFGHHCTSSSYSGTCLERPPNWPQKCGLSKQVVYGDRFSYIEM